MSSAQSIDSLRELNAKLIAKVEAENVKLKSGNRIFMAFN
jgi:hypothetical protein